MQIEEREWLPLHVMSTTGSSRSNSFPNIVGARRVVCGEKQGLAWLVSQIASSYLQTLTLPNEAKCDNQDLRTSGPQDLRTSGSGLLDASELPVVSKRGLYVQNPARLCKDGLTPSIDSV
eukprot:138503-Pelagomonas_calceolata.AAC.4